LVEQKDNQIIQQNQNKKELSDGAYRIIFSGKKSNTSKFQGENFHNRINPRDKSLDNFHGDALP
jgi:hypothetical protein